MWEGCKPLEYKNNGNQLGRKVHVCNVSTQETGRRGTSRLSKMSQKLEKTTVKVTHTHIEKDIEKWEKTAGKSRQMIYKI